MTRNIYAALAWVLVLVPLLGAAPRTVDQAPGEAGDELADAVQIVYTWTELSQAMGDESVTKIYLGADITMTGGIPINHNKESLLISGRPPGGDVVHTLTDALSSDQGQTIYLENKGNFDTITIRDIRFIGQNYFGPVSVRNGCEGVHLEYVNVEYNGPQMSYNPTGTARIADCTIKLQPGASPAEEAAETCGVSLGGTVSITQLTQQDNETFYFTARDGYIQIEDGADVTVTNHPASSGAGFVYTAGHAVTMSVGADARFTFSAARRFWEASAMKSLDIGEAARVNITLTGAPHNTVLRIDGGVRVERDGWLHIVQETGSTGLPCLAAYSIELNDPESVVLVNPLGQPLATVGSPNFVSIAGQQVNWWGTAGDGGLDDVPAHHWRKAQAGENLTISGTLGENMNGAWQADFATNWEHGDVGGDTGPDPSSFAPGQTRVISVGRLDLSAEYLPPEGESVAGGVTGLTATGAQVDVQYTDTGGAEHRDSGTAGDGAFTIPLTAPPDPEEAITVRAAWQYLRAWTVADTGPGVLLLLDTADMPFRPTSPSAHRQDVARREPDWALTIYDSRPAGSQWTLYASVSGPLTSADGNTLDGGLVFLDGSGGEKPLGTDPVVLHSGQAGSGPQTTHINWLEDQGILLRVQSGAGRAGTTYGTTIHWLLVDGPA